jgi:hypothetical protein
MSKFTAVTTKFSPGDDKVEHGLAGIVLMVGGWAAGLPWWVVLPLAIMVMAGKEIFDYYSGTGNPDIWDFICGVVGIGVGLIVVAFGIYATSKAKK